MIVQVTLSHIRGGTPQSCTGCPIALAVDGMLADDCWVEVGPEYMTVTDHDNEQQLNFVLPYNAREFIDKYDDERQVSPIEFELDLPDEVLKPEFRSGVKSESLAKGNRYLVDDGDDF